MAAIELLKSGEVLETIHVDQDVFRVGSDPHATVTLPSGPAHRLTVVTRNGRTQVVNRDSVGIAMQGRTVPPRATGNWVPGQPLELGGDLSLRLKANGGQPLSRRKRRRSQTPAKTSQQLTEEQTEIEEKPKDQRTTALLACLTVAMMVLVLGMSGPSDSRGNNAEFVRVVDNLASLDEPRFKHVRALLQEARAFELREMPADAGGRYSQALSILRASQGEIGSYSASGSLPIIQQSLAYAESGYRRVGS
ncbi:MAG: hypothetical protein AAF266_07125 [Planctomycetota bacterium]